MKKSELLKQAIELASNTSLESLWKQATGGDWEENSSQYDEELGLFWNDTDNFVIVPYVTRMTGSGWKQTFEQQNAAIFIGWVGDNELVNRSLSDMLEERIEELEYIEFQWEQTEKH